MGMAEFSLEMCEVCGGLVWEGGRKEGFSSTPRSGHPPWTRGLCMVCFFRGFQAFPKI